MSHIHQESDDDCYQMMQGQDTPDIQLLCSRCQPKVPTMPPE